MTSIGQGFLSLLAWMDLVFIFFLLARVVEERIFTLNRMWAQLVHLTSKRLYYVFLVRPKRARETSLMSLFTAGVAFHQEPFATLTWHSNSRSLDTGGTRDTGQVNARFLGIEEEEDIRHFTLKERCLTPSLSNLLTAPSDS